MTSQARVLGVALVLASMAVAGCSSGGAKGPTGTYVARIGNRSHAVVRVRRASSEESSRVPVGHTWIGSFCTRSESGSRRAPTRGRPTVVRRGSTLFVRRPGLARPEPLARGVTYNEWSPNGRTLAFVRTPEYIDRATGIAWPEGDSLHLVKADGTGLRGYGRWLSIDSIAWSPDAERIALSTPSGIWFIEAHHVGRRRVTHPEGFEDICPTWLDAGTIAFYRDIPNALP